MRIPARLLDARDLVLWVLHVLVTVTVNGLVAWGWPYEASPDEPPSVPLRRLVLWHGLADRGTREIEHHLARVAAER